jgi:hypothetical protein
VQWMLRMRGCCEQQPLLTLFAGLDLRSPVTCVSLSLFGVCSSNK